MAATSLGRLTLDLAVKLSEFTDGMSKAERETKDKTDKMRKSVRTFKDQVMEDLGGTEIGGAIGSLSDRLSALRGGGMIAGAALGGIVVGGAIAATGALASMAIQTAQADAQLATLAARANTSLQNFQVLSAASQQFGVSQEQLGDILADVQEKLGEFSATEGGGAADFFDALKNNTSLTTEEIRELGRTVQGKDGVEAIQLLKDKMDELGATQQEQRFVFESLASDLGNLLPLFDQGGEKLAKYGKALEDAGVIKTEEAIEQSKILNAQTQALHIRYDGFKQQLSTQMIPVLNTLLDHFSEGSQKGNQFGGIIKSVGVVAKSTATIILGLATGVGTLIKLFKGAQAQMFNIGQTGTAFINADGLSAKVKALSDGVGRAQNIHAEYTDSIITDWKRTYQDVTGMWSGLSVETDGLAQSMLELQNASGAAASGLSRSTVEAKEAEKAAKALAKANDKVTKSKTRMEQVYDALRFAGMSDNQARAMTAEIGREGSFLDKNLFGYHIDPANGAVNAGMISWQGARGKALIKFLQEQGVIKNGGIEKTQEALNAQALFIVKEIMENSAYSKTKNEFLAKPDISYKEAAPILGRNYIKWRYDDPKFARGHRNRDTFYNQLNSKIGNKGLANDLASQLRDEQKAVQEEQRRLEEIQKKQMSVAYKWASEREKLELDLQKNISEINEAYGEDSAEAKKYRAEAQAAFDKQIADRTMAIMKEYWSEEERLEAQHNERIEAIKTQFVENDPTRQLALDLEEAQYQESLKKLQWANGAKLREQQKYIQNLQDAMRESMDVSLQSSIDRTMKSQLRPEEYEQWRLGEDEAKAYNSVSSQYRSRQAEINKTGDLGEYILPEEERFALLEEAKLEHEQKLYAIEKEFADKRTELEKQQADMRAQIQASAFSDMASAARLFFGENSRMHRLGFALEKAYAVQKAVMNIDETYSNTFNAISAIPIVGPYIAGPMAVAASAMQVARAASLKSMSAPSIAGIAHGGLDYVPKEATYLLDEGEGVLAPKQNQDLKNFLSEQKNSPRQPNIIINNNSSAKVQAGVNSRGEVTIDMVDRMIKNSFKNLRNANSVESKQIQRYTTARPNRR